MAETVNVRSIEALKHFRGEYGTFAEEARNALSSVEMEIRRTRDWLERQQLPYWVSQVKRGNERVSQARTDLHRKRISQSGSDAISDSDQKEALRMAQKQLREAEEKVKKVKHWIPVLQHAIAEYHSLSQPLGDRLQGDVEHALALLERMVISLESYVALTAPQAAHKAFTALDAASAGPATTATGSAAAGSQGGSDVEEAPVPEETAAQGEAEPAESAEAGPVAEEDGSAAASAGAETRRVPSP